MAIVTNVMRNQSSIFRLRTPKNQCMVVKPGTSHKEKLCHYQSRISISTFIYWSSLVAQYIKYQNKSPMHDYRTLVASSQKIMDWK